MFIAGLEMFQSVGVVSSPLDQKWILHVVNDLAFVSWVAECSEFTVCLEKKKKN